MEKYVNDFEILPLNALIKNLVLKCINFLIHLHKCLCGLMLDDER